MAQNAPKTLASLILDEIALEGLEGITISGIWIRLSESLQFPLPLLLKFKIQVWNVILQSKNHLQFYLLPEPREKLKIWNRFAVTDPDYGVPVVNISDCPFTLYKCVPIFDGIILGSCETYHTRKPITFDEIQSMSLEEIESKYSDILVIVASQKLRYNCLIPPNVSIPTDITAPQYCVLEFIGRSRSNGTPSAGKYSIIHCCKDASVGFYIKNKLCRLGVIVSQPYTEKRNDRLIGSSLLTLTRFFKPNKTAFAASIEKMFLAVKNTPKQIMPLSSLKGIFPSENQSMIKKILSTNVFRRIFQTLHIAVKDLDELQCTSKAIGDRDIVCVKLNDPNMTEDDLFSEEKKEQEKEISDFFDYKHTFVDMPLAEEIFRAIEKFGSTGCSQSQLCSVLSMNHLNVRQSVKKMITEKIVVSYCKDMGRQRTNIFVASNCANSIEKVKVENKNITDNLKCNDEPNLPPDPDPPLKDIHQISTTINKVINKFVNKINLREDTVKQVERKQKIVELINKQCLMQVPEMRQEIIKAEVAAGYEDEICNKSLYRTIWRLQDTGIVNMFEVTFRFEDYARNIRYVSHPKITTDHYVVKNEIIKQKNMIFLYLEDRKCRAENLKITTAKTKALPRVGLIPPGPQKSPKFLTARFLHDFMIYTRFEMSSNVKPIKLTEDLVEKWVEAEPNINFVDLYKSMINDNMIPYRERLNWRTFIPPLPEYADKPYGWLSFPDVIDRLPFSLLNKIIHVPPGVEPIAMEYLKHPVRQHYLIKQLPVVVQSLINRKRFNRILNSILQVLQRMGLIQISDRKVKDPLQLWIYLNQKASVLDTTTSEPGYIEINKNREYKTICFNINKRKSAEEYWNCLHRICILTKLGFVNKNNVTGKTQEDYKRGLTELNGIVSPVSSFDEAPLLDNGIPPGDGLGAGGLTSRLYPSFHRNWTWLVNNKHTSAAVAAAEKLKRNSKIIRTKISKLKNGNSKEKVTNSGITKITLRKMKTVPKSKMVKRRSGAIKKEKTSFIADSIDEEAIKQMKSLRARWSEREDRLLKMTRATFLFLKIPIVHFSLRDVAKISRDLIRQQFCIYNKTTQACHRRISFMVKRKMHLPDLPIWVHFLQTHEQLNLRYDTDNILSDLKELYPVKSDLHNALSVHFLHVFKILQDHLNFQDPNHCKQRKDNLPDTLSKFYSKFRECAPLNDTNALLYFNPTTKQEIEVSTINNVLHSSLCCNRDKTQFNLQIFDIFKTFSEEVLNLAFKTAHSDRLVVARKKSQVQRYTTQLTGPSFVFSNKYRMSLMFLRIPYVVFDMLHAFFDQVVAKIFDETKSYVEIKSPHSGQLVFMAELNWKDYIKVEIRPPSNILTIDPSAQHSNITDTKRILNHFQNILGNAPETEYSKHFEALDDQSTKVKFKAGNVHHKMHYHPFDYVSKLEIINVHFFCFLCNLNRWFDITFSQFKDATEITCPFSDCVLNEINYLEAIQKIVQDRSSILEEIHEDMEMESEAESLTISAANVIAVFEKFKTFWRQKFAKEEKKDLGFTALRRMPVDFVQICKNISNANELLKDDEHEPALNKEERIAKAQDVFVVNLPTLQIHANACEEEMLKYKGCMLPKSLAEVALMKESVLNKIIEDSCWSYTLNNLETLKTEKDWESFSEQERKSVVEIHDFIKSFKLGVSGIELLDRFPDIKLLAKATALLRKHFLVLRAGVASFIYIHHNYVRSWVVNSRHIKRLDRESMGKLIPKGDDKTIKRKLNPEKDENEPVAKHSKSDELGKRISKPVQRFEDRVEVTTSNLSSNNDPKDLLVLKPCPWIRVNGSLNRRVLDKWMGSIVIECSAATGITVHGICSRFKQMFGADIMYLLEVLNILKIVELKCLKPRKKGLLDKFEMLEEYKSTEFYDPKHTYVIVAPDALTRMSLFIGDKQYQSEFV